LSKLRFGVRRRERRVLQRTACRTGSLFVGAALPGLQAEQ
jgi:hypothetical protein